MKLSDYRKISDAINADLKAVLEKHGFRTTKLKATIEESLGILNLRIEAADVNHKSADGSTTTPEAEIYKQLCSLYELDAAWLGKTFRQGRDEYRLTGMRNTRGAKNITIVKVADGKTYVTTPDHVRAFMIAQNVKAAS